MRSFLLCVLAGVAMSASSPANALVRFGHSVFVGGHDFSNQTYGPKRRAVIHLYKRTPRNEGCRWHADGHGGRVKVCHLRVVSQFEFVGDLGQLHMQRGAAKIA